MDEEEEGNIDAEELSDFDEDDDDDELDDEIDRIN